MPILDKVYANVNICGLQLSFTGEAVPSIIEGWQPFYNSTFENATFEKTYASIASIDFSEESKNTAAGVSWTQRVVFRFPGTDSKRSERLALMHKIKFVKIKLDSGREIIVGRNDFFQNALPKVTTKTNQQTYEVALESKSISPSGYTPNPDSFGLPVLIPIEL